MKPFIVEHGKLVVVLICVIFILGAWLFRMGVHLSNSDTRQRNSPVVVIEGGDKATPVPDKK